ncbi:MAG: zinc ribbon domain-containing protein [Acidimicrobiia bacterium]|nr:zinc ribbon domain-containing protein [Acidimicrobiia bacterium]
MPTYEYRCEKCGQTFEVVQSFKDRSLRRHPECGGNLGKVFHPRGVTFKGSGFYATDSRAKQTTSASNGKGDDGTKTKSDSGKSTEKAPVAAASSDPTD